MSDATHITLQTGRETGGGAAARTRSEGLIPGVVYGLGKDTVPVAVDRGDLRRALSTDAGRNALLTAAVGDDSDAVIVKEIQRHPVRRDVLHVDFQRVDPDRKLTMTVPILVIGEPKALMVEGGMIEQVLDFVDVRCRADAIPGELSLDVTAASLGHSFHVSDLETPDGVEVLTDAEEAVVACNLTRAAMVGSDEDQADGATVASAQSGAGSASADESAGA